MPTPCLSINTCQLYTFEIGTGKSPCLVVSKAAEAGTGERQVTGSPSGCLSGGCRRLHVCRDGVVQGVGTDWPLKTQSGRSDFQIATTQLGFRPHDVWWLQVTLQPGGTPRR